jgi:hypothetical protein
MRTHYYESRLTIPLIIPSSNWGNGIRKPSRLSPSGSWTWKLLSVSIAPQYSIAVRILFLQISSVEYLGRSSVKKHVCAHGSTISWLRCLPSESSAILKLILLRLSPRGKLDLPQTNFKNAALCGLLNSSKTLQNRCTY